MQNNHLNMQRAYLKDSLSVMDVVALNQAMSNSYYNDATPLSYANLGAFIQAEACNPHCSNIDVRALSYCSTKNNPKKNLPSIDKSIHLMTEAINYYDQAIGFNPSGNKNFSQFLNTNRLDKLKKICPHDPEPILSLLNKYHDFNKQQKNSYKATKKWMEMENQSTFFKIMNDLANIASEAQLKIGTIQAIKGFKKQSKLDADDSISTKAQHNTRDTEVQYKQKLETRHVEEMEEVQYKPSLKMRMAAKKLKMLHAEEMEEAKYNQRLEKEICKIKKEVEVKYKQQVEALHAKAMEAQAQKITAQAKENKELAAKCKTQQIELENSNSLNKLLTEELKIKDGLKNDLQAQYDKLYDLQTQYDKLNEKMNSQTQQLEALYAKEMEAQAQKITAQAKENKELAAKCKTQQIELENSNSLNELLTEELSIKDEFKLESEIKVQEMKEQHAKEIKAQDQEYEELRVKANSVVREMKAKVKEKEKVIEDQAQEAEKLTAKIKAIEDQAQKMEAQHAKEMGAKEKAIEGLKVQTKATDNKLEEHNSPKHADKKYDSMMQKVDKYIQNDDNAYASISSLIPQGNSESDKLFRVNNEEGCQTNHTNEDSSFAHPNAGVDHVGESF